MVLASFVVNHVPDPRAAVRELARVAAPGGRVGVTIWPSGQNAQSRFWAAVLAESGAVVPPSVGLPADLDFPRTREGLAGLLAGAGLRDVDARPLAWVHRTAPDALWRGAAAGVGGIGTVVTSQSDEVRDAMRSAYDRLVRPAELPRRRASSPATEALFAVGAPADAATSYERAARATTSYDVSRNVIRSGCPGDHVVRRHGA